jgi:hypothetical protein
MNFKDFFQSKKIKIALAVIFVLIIILLIFQAGIYVGFKKASFSYQWGENYYKNFAGPRGGFMDDIRGGKMMAPHGVFGTIIKIDGNSLIVSGGSEMEKAVLIGGDTIIKKFQETLSLSDLKVNDKITVIGSPTSDGRIEAKLIRVLPKPPAGAPLPYLLSAPDKFM